jgi:hypothetical protein
MGKLRTSEASVLESYRVALENATNQPEIASEMGELGYDAAKIEEGKAKLASTRAVYDFNKKEDAETSEASLQYKNAQQTVVKTYSAHRKKAKIVFRDQPETLKLLQLNGSIPEIYIRWIECVRTFYTVLSSNADLLAQLQRLKVDASQITGVLQNISALEKTRAEYLREKGESEDATQKKDKALADMDRWMSEFYAVARIALEDNPQLLEALGKVVK